MATVQSMTARIAEIARLNVGRELPPEERARLVNEVETLQGDLYELAEDRRFAPNAAHPLPAPDYLDERLSGLCSFARMALGEEERRGYTPWRIIQNVEGYRSAVERLIG